MDKNKLIKNRINHFLNFLKKDKYSFKNYNEIYNSNYINLNLDLSDFQFLIKQQISNMELERKKFLKDNPGEPYYFKKIEIEHNECKITFYDERYHNINLDRNINIEDQYSEYNLYYQYIRYSITKVYTFEGTDIEKIDSYSFSDLIYIRNMENINEYYGEDAIVKIKSIKFDKSFKSEWINNILNKKI